jgi:hypothetical protein
VVFKQVYYSRDSQLPALGDTVGTGWPGPDASPVDITAFVKHSEAGVVRSKPPKILSSQGVFNQKNGLSPPYPEVYAERGLQARQNY